MKTSLILFLLFSKYNFQTCSRRVFNAVPIAVMHLQQTIFHKECMLTFWNQMVTNLDIETWCFFREQLLALWVNFTKDRGMFINSFLYDNNTVAQIFQLIYLHIEQRRGHQGAMFMPDVHMQLDHPWCLLNPETASILNAMLRFFFCFSIHFFPQ